MRNLRALLLLLYIIALFVIPVYHITEVSATASGCSACSAGSQRSPDYFGEVTASSNQVSVSERCEPNHPCHNPNHTHHNHPSHDHNCSLCATIQGFANNLSPNTDNTVLDFSSAPTYKPIDDIIHNGFVSQSIDIRGPPVL